MRAFASGWHTAAFYRLLSVISELQIPLDSGDFCLMDRRIVDTLNRLPEKGRFVRGLRSFLGFDQVALEYDRPAREAGRPKYTLRKLSGLAVDGLISFSSYPLRMVTYIGMGTASVALILTVWVLNDAIRHQTAPRGWASTLVVVLFIGAIQLLSLGIIGEYIRLIFLETKNRPTYIIADLKRHDSNDVRSSATAGASDREPTIILCLRGTIHDHHLVARRAGHLHARGHSHRVVGFDSPSPMVAGPNAARAGDSRAIRDQTAGTSPGRRLRLGSDTGGSRAAGISRKWSRCVSKRARTC